MPEIYSDSDTIMIYDDVKLGGYLSLYLALARRGSIYGSSLALNLQTQPESWKSDAWAGEPQGRRKEDPGSPARWNFLPVGPIVST